MWDSMLSSWQVNFVHRIVVRVSAISDRLPFFSLPLKRQEEM